MARELVVLTLATLHHQTTHPLRLPADKTTERSVVLVIPSVPAIFYQLPNLAQTLNQGYNQEFQLLSHLATHWDIPQPRQWVAYGAFKPTLRQILEHLQPERVYGLEQFPWITQPAATFWFESLRRIFGAAKKHCTKKQVMDFLSTSNNLHGEKKDDFKKTSPIWLVDTNDL